MKYQADIGIIGGSGLYELDQLEIIEKIEMNTPLGRPSAPITLARLGDRTLAFLPRHGVYHEFTPTEVPYRANIWAMKMLGVNWIITASAVGSLKKEIAPGDFVIPDQVIDKTTKRDNCLYEGFAAHVSLAHPFEPILRDLIIKTIESSEIDITLHKEGTYVCMEGPAFSTKAESKMHQLWGATIVGMTAMPEARFAREAEIAYATIAMPTDYDVWFDGEEVDINDILQVLKRNQENVKKILLEVIPRIPIDRYNETISSTAMQYAIMTKRHKISDEAQRRYSIILDKYNK